MNGNQNNFYLCEFCGEIKQVQILPKSFQLFIEVVSNIFQFNKQEAQNFIWTYEGFNIENNRNNDNSISFKNEGIELNENNYQHLFNKSNVIIHLKFKEAEKKVVQDHWNKTSIAEQAKSRIINRIKGNIQKRQNEIEQAAPLASSIIISNLSDFIKNKFLKTKLELISEIQNNNRQLQNNKSNNNEGNQKQNLIEHKRMCSYCHVYPIIGVMYKCVICKDYELCSNCEEKVWNIHKHSFYKLVYPFKVNTQNK